MGRNNAMNIKRLVPDSLTCCNLLCGAVATYMATQQEFLFAFLLILTGAVFDFFDGASARLLKVPSPIGVELDSLADDITFGLAPSMMLCCYLHPLIGWWSLLALLMAAFSALRLAKFNLDKRQTSSFIGLATPPNAIFWASLTCIPDPAAMPSWIPWTLIAISFVSCFLLICEIPFFGLKFHSLKWQDNKRAYLFLIGCIIIIVFCIVRACQLGHPRLAAMAGCACILWYVLYNVITQPRRNENN